MDLATILGVFIAFALMIWAIVSGGSPQAFVDLPSMLIVIGGAFGASMVAIPAAKLKQITKVLGKALKHKEQSPDKLIADLVSYAEIARRDGILSLESTCREIDDPFIVRGIQMAVDGTDPELIEQIMTTELDNLMERHESGQALFNTLGKYAPAFGMIGTLIGLVQMLGNLSSPDDIGSGMATALITTFYGAVLANLVYIPLAGKLGLRSKREIFLREMVVEGVLGIVRGESPTAVREKMQTFVSEKNRQDVKPTV